MLECFISASRKYWCISDPLSLFPHRWRGPTTYLEADSLACNVTSMGRLSRDEHEVRPGESCWEISKAHGCQLDKLIQANSNVDCDRLLPGTMMCLPDATLPLPTAGK